MAIRLQSELQLPGVAVQVIAVPLVTQKDLALRRLPNWGPTRVNSTVFHNIFPLYILYAHYIPTILWPTKSFLAP